MFVQKVWLLAIVALIVQSNKEVADVIEGSAEDLFDNNGIQNNKIQVDQSQSPEGSDKKQKKEPDSTINPETVLENSSKIKPWKNDKEEKLQANEFSDNSSSSEPVRGNCNLDLLKQFGIKVTEENEAVQRPFNSNAVVKSYCRRNVNSCCLGEEIMQLENYFTRAKKQLEERFQPLQEMIVLFKGNRYEEVLFEVNQKEECKQILTDSELYKAAHNEDHFMNTILPTEIDRMMSLLTDSEVYVKKNYWFFGNMICVVCNPNQVQFIHLDNKDPYMDYNINNCAESIEMSEFENRAIMAYEFFFKTWVYLSQCLTGNYKNPEYKVPDLDIKNVNENIKKYSNCYKDFDFSSQQCRELCSNKKFDSYQFPIKFFEATMVALKNLFPVFTQVTLEEFYEKTKDKKPEEIAKDDPINFFEDFSGSKLNEAKIKISDTQGIFIYQNQISKKFYNFVEKKKKNGSLILAAVNMLFLFWF